jgi:hypothetical protein
VLAFIHDGELPDLAGCDQYDGGRCVRGGLCAFHEDADADVWRKAADWRILPGGGVVHRDLWPAYGLEGVR